MKKITRVARLNATKTLTAGAYTAGATAPAVVATFNLLITGIYISAVCIDSVTAQLLEGAARVQASVEVIANNPGLSSAQLSQLMYAPMGAQSFFQVHYPLGAGESLTLTTIFYLPVVTANDVTGNCSMTVVYECPEDYLSIDGLLISPK